MSSSNEPETLQDQPARIGEESGKKGETWKRIVYTLGFGFIAYFALLLLFLVSLVQAIFLVATGKRNDEVTSFGRNLATYLADVMVYVAWASEEKPFPAKSFPGESKVIS